MNLLDAQKTHNAWPHFFRVRVLHNDRGYRDAVAASQPKIINWVRVIRDPYKRAVSSYRQALMDGHDDGPIGSFLGRLVDERRGFSFREYVDWLATAAPDTVNPHDYPQRHRLEDHVTPCSVINIDRRDLWSELRAFEIAANIAPMSDHNEALLRQEVARIALLHHMVRSPDRNAPDLVPSRAAKIASWPEYDDYLVPEIRKKIEKIYAIDFHSYGSLL